MSIKIGVVSDTHIFDKEKEIPQEILTAFKQVDMVIHCGDLVNLNVLNKLKTVCGTVKAVWGNMDPEEVRKELPEKELIKIGKYTIGVMHGIGVPNKLIDLLTRAFQEDNVNVIVFGHSHVPVNEKRGGVLFFNPGSATDKVFAPYNSYGILEINDEIAGKIIRI